MNGRAMGQLAGEAIRRRHSLTPAEDFAAPPTPLPGNASLGLVLRLEERRVSSREGTKTRSKMQRTSPFAPLFPACSRILVAVLRTAPPPLYCR